MIKKVRENIKNNPDYFITIVSGYLLMGFNMVIQVFLVPFYLKYLGSYEFGILMVMLSFINYAAFGVGWMSGGALRVLGEYAAQQNNEGFIRGVMLSRTVYVGYAVVIGLLMVGIGLVVTGHFVHIPDKHLQVVRWSLVGAAFYFIVLYDFSVDRLVLTSVKRQAIGNILQLLSLVVFAVGIFFALRSGGGLYWVFISLLIGNLLGKLVCVIYMKSQAIPNGWYLPGREDLPLLKRLLGPMGLGFFIYGFLLLTLQADTMIIGWVGGAEMAAQFVLIWKIPEVLIQLIWRIPEAMSPYLVHLDARKERGKLAYIYRRGLRWISLISMIIGLIYACFGYKLVCLWVGIANAPTEVWGYVLGGICIFWLGTARLPSVFALATVNLSSLNRVAAVELVIKIIIILAFVSKLGYLAPIVGTNLAHLGGIHIAYRRLFSRFSSKDTDYV